MRRWDKARWRALGVVVLLAIVLSGGVASAVERAGYLEVEAWGDMRYAHFDYGPDQTSGDNGSPPDGRAVLDVPFFVTELAYYFTPSLYLEAEVEYEHGGTGAAMELEYDEFGEYETEVEKGGEVRLEEVHLTRSFGRALNLRAGRFVTAVGLVNPSHAPTEFFTTTRAESEVSMIPTTWDEIGVELFGATGPLAWRVQLINALDSSGFSSKYWLAGGHQKKFELVSATDLAVVGRLDWELMRGFVLGGSLYYGNTTGTRPKPDMKGIDGHVTLGDVHALLDRGPVRGRALYMAGSLENAALISAKNSRLSTALQVSRTPVAKGAFAWSGEVGVDVVWFFDRAAGYRLYPFVRYEHFDTMADVDAGVFADPRFERKVLTGGVNYFPHDDVVVKLDASRRTFGSDRLNAENTVSMSIGFDTELFEN